MKHCNLVVTKKDAYQDVRLITNEIRALWRSEVEIIDICGISRPNAVRLQESLAPALADKQFMAYWRDDITLTFETIPDARWAPGMSIVIRHPKELLHPKKKKKHLGNGFHSYRRPFAFASGY